MPHPVEFRLPAYRVLMKGLGESDAMVEWIEVGVREVAYTANTMGAAQAKSLAKKHQVCVSPIDFADLSHGVARLQILAVYQHAEAFFRGFARTHPRHIELKRNTDEDPLSATIKAFGIVITEDSKLDVDLFQYYRQARNIVMHASEPPADHQTSCQRLRERIADSTYRNIDAPNTVFKMQFDDFVLFTRSLKELATHLCKATVPTDDELIAAMRRNGKLVARLRSLSNNKRRSEKLLSNFLMSTYSLPIERVDMISERMVREVR